MTKINKKVLLLLIVLLMIISCADNSEKIGGTTWKLTGGLTRKSDNTTGQPYNIFEVKRKEMLLPKVTLWLYRDGTFEILGKPNNDWTSKGKWRTRMGGGIELTYSIPSLGYQSSETGYIEGNKLIFKSGDSSKTYERMKW